MIRTPLASHCTTIERLEKLSMPITAYNFRNPLLLALFRRSVILSWKVDYARLTLDLETQHELHVRWGWVAGCMIQ